MPRDATQASRVKPRHAGALRPAVERSLEGETDPLVKDWIERLLRHGEWLDGDPAAEQTAPRRKT
jgi:hypothetical protein